MAEATQNQLPKPSDNPLLASVQGLSNLSVLRQIGVMLGLAATFAAVIAIFMWAQTPNYSLLYANLTEKDTSTIIDTLQQQGIQYKLDPATGALLVPSKDLQSVKLKLAAEGLPHSTGMGFETLREDSGFGTSQFLETARFQRSLEVELARSIANINNVETARVHLAIPKSSVFIRNRMKPSASVIVHLHAGRSLEEDQVDAITHLVAFSVPELEAGSVTVVDQKGRLLSGRKQSEQMALSTDQLEYAQKIEKNYMERIINILMPVVGPQGVQAQVTADVDFSVTEQTQELFNPDAPSLRSQQVAEESTSGA
ncbi:MAG: flagellar basal-body MS-ring/collar protein FliF, partial [Pseudomonadota bacterium]